jgi:hypothetical protein
MYKVGDKVCIKTDIDEVPWLGINPIMAKFYGETHVIKGIVTIDEDNDLYAYTLDNCFDEEDGMDWYWAEQWLEDSVTYQVNENDIEEMLNV